MKTFSKIVIIFLITSMLFGCAVSKQKSTSSDDVNTGVPDTTVDDDQPDVTTTVESTTNNEPITQPLPEVTYEILVIDGEYYLEFSGADAYELKDYRLITGHISFNSVEEMYDSITNHSLEHDDMLKAYYFFGDPSNQHRVKMFDLSTIIIPKTNDDNRIFSYNSFEQEEARWEEDFYSDIKKKDDQRLWFEVLTEDKFDDELQSLWVMSSKTEYVQENFSDGTVREVAYDDTDDEVNYIERFIIEENNKKYYICSIYNYSEISKSGFYSHRVLIEDNGLYYVYVAQIEEDGYSSPLSYSSACSLTLEDIRGLSYEKIPYVAE